MDLAKFRNIPGLKYLNRHIVKTVPETGIFQIFGDLEPDIGNMNFWRPSHNCDHSLALLWSMSATHEVSGGFSTASVG